MTMNQTLNRIIRHLTAAAMTITAIAILLTLFEGSYREPQTDKKGVLGIIGQTHTAIAILPDAQAATNPPTNLTEKNFLNATDYQLYLNLYNLIYQAMLNTNSTAANTVNLAHTINHLENTIKALPTASDMTTILSYYTAKVSNLTLQTTQTDLALVQAINQLADKIDKLKTTGTGTTTTQNQTQTQPPTPTGKKLTWYLERRSLYTNQTQYVNLVDPGDLDDHLTDIDITLDGTPIIAYSYRIKLIPDDLGLEPGEYSVRVKSDYYTVQNSIQTFTLKPAATGGGSTEQGGTATLIVDEQTKTVKMVSMTGQLPLVGTITWDYTTTQITDGNGATKWPTNLQPGVHKLRGVPYDNRYGSITDFQVEITPKWEVTLGTQTYGRLKAGEALIQPQITDEKTGYTEENPYYTIQFIKAQKSMGMFTIGAGADWISFYSGAQKFQGIQRINAAGTYLVNVQTPDGNWKSTQIVVKAFDPAVLIWAMIFPGFFPGLFILSKWTTGSINPKYLFTRTRPGTGPGVTQTAQTAEPRFQAEEATAHLLPGG